MISGLVMTRILLDEKNLSETRNIYPATESFILGAMKLGYEIRSTFSFVDK